MSNWTQVSSTDTSSIVFGYTPVVLDTAETLQFRATYLDNFDNAQSKTLFANTANTVLAQPLANLPPTFDESSPLTRSIAKDVVVCGNIGSPVSATDPEGDILTYLLFEYYSDHFVIDAATGQISLDVDAMLDYKSARTHYMRVVELDGKDRDGNDDSDVVGPDKYDISSLVTVSATSVEEAGIVTLSSNHPEVGEALVASSCRSGWFHRQSRMAVADCGQQPVRYVEQHYRRHVRQLHPILERFRQVPQDEGILR